MEGGRVSADRRRDRRSGLWSGIGNELAVALRIVVGGEFEHPIEDKSPASRASPVEMEDQLVEIALEVSVVEAPRVRSEVPALGD